MKRDILEDKFKEYFTEPEVHNHLEYLNDAASGKVAVEVPFDSNGGDYEGPFPINLQMSLDAMDHIMKNAEESIEAANKVIFEVMEGMKPHVRFKHLLDKQKKSIRNLRQSDKNKLLKIPGIVRNVGEKEARLKKAVYTCMSCGTRFKETGNPENPMECSGCGKSNNKTVFKLDENKSEYEDIQKIKIQEPTEKLEGGRQPDSIVGVLKDDLVGEVEGGERVDLNAILKLKKKSKNSDSFKKYLKINNIEIKERTFSTIELTQEDIEKIEEMKSEEEVFQKIVESIAPDIYGMEMEKQAIALQLFGGVRKTLNRSPKRGDIHILLIGDPGTAKSQLLHSVAKLAPKSMYESGKGSSGVGLTAAVTKDEELGGWTVEAGVLPLCDGGIACMDEIDKMSDDDREHMNDAMGTAQCIPVAKAGKTMTLRSRTSVLAAGNPQYGRFDIHDNISNQIDIHPSLLDRFDLIFPILDQPNVDVDHDEKKSEHIAKMHRDYMEDETEDMGEIDDELIRKYVAHARKIKPKYTERSQEKIVEFYNKMRRKSDDTVKITPRQLDTLHRLAEASARSRLSETVEVKDSKKAIQVFGYFLNEVSTDATGEIDIDGVMTGYTQYEKTLREQIEQAIRAYDAGNGVAKSKIIENIDEDDSQIEKQLESMRTAGLVYTPETEVYKLG